MRLGIGRSQNRQARGVENAQECVGRAQLHALWKLRILFEFYPYRYIGKLLIPDELSGSASGIVSKMLGTAI